MVPPPPVIAQVYCSSYFFTWLFPTKTNLTASVTLPPKSLTSHQQQTYHKDNTYQSSWYWSHHPHFSIVLCSFMCFSIVKNNPFREIFPKRASKWNKIFYSNLTSSVHPVTYHSGWWSALEHLRPLISGRMGNIKSAKMGQGWWAKRSSDEFWKACCGSARTSLTPWSLRW